LNNSKIAISPKGFTRYECFRHYEAARAGCVVITETNPNPDLWYLKESPFVQLNKWSDLRKCVTSLLEDPEELERLQQRTIKWWENCISEEAVARYMASKLNI
jgi:hypothetical protein